jgi:tetratricopeptide (TPR) repeat protein
MSDKNTDKKSFLSFLIGREAQHDTWRSPSFLLCALLGFAIVYWAYFNHFHNPFQFDDDHTIVNNTAIRKLDIVRYFKDPTTVSTLPSNQVFRPGLTTLNALDYKWSGDKAPDPYVYHRSIFISFIVLLVLLFLFVKSILIQCNIFKYANASALFCAIWYGVHAANAETINYIIARSDSFSTLMMLAGFVVYQYFPAKRKYFFYLLPMIPGFLVKEPAVMFAPLLFVYHFFIERKEKLFALFSKKIWPSILHCLPAFLLAAVLFVYGRMHTPPGFSPSNTPWYFYALTQPYVFIHYIQNFILPINLVVDTDMQAVKSFSDDRVFSGIIFLVVLFFIVVKTSSKAALLPIGFGISWFIISLLPTSSIFPLSEVLNDHRPFLPSIGLFISVVVFIRFLLSKWKPSRAMNIFMLVLLSGFLFAHASYTRKRCVVWSSSETLWKEATIKAPNNGRAWMNYGNALMARGEWSGAELCFRKTISLSPYYSYAYINMGVLLNATKRFNEAEPNYKYAIELDPNNPEAFYYYGMFLLNRVRLNDALGIVQKGLALSPVHEGLNILKQNIEMALKNSVQQISSGEDELIIKASNEPTADNYLNLSLYYYNAGKFELCIKAAEESLKINSNYDPAYNNICAAYNAMKQFDKAVEAGKKGIAINPNNQLLLNNLKWALSNLQK